MVDPRFYTVNYPQGFGLEDFLSWGGGKLDLSALSMPTPLKGVSAPEFASVQDLIYFDSKGALEAVGKSRAAYCLTTTKLASLLPKHMRPIICESPKRLFSKIASALFTPKITLQGQTPVHPAAQVDQSAEVGSYVVLGEGAQIGPNSKIGAGTVIEAGVTIGENVMIEPNCTIRCADIANNVRIGAGTRIGQEGFGFVMDEQGHISVPHLGQVVIENDVKIGANCCIDRAALGVTRIQSGCRLDNLVQIAHNVEVGSNSVMAAQVGVAGSTKIGKFVVIGGQAGFSQHLTIHDGVQIAAQSGIMGDIPAKSVYSGSPAVPIGQWRRQNVLLRKMVKKGN